MATKGPNTPTPKGVKEVNALDHSLIPSPGGSISFSPENGALIFQKGKLNPPPANVSRQIPPEKKKFSNSRP